VNDIRTISDGEEVYVSITDLKMFLYRCKQGMKQSPALNYNTDVQTSSMATIDVIIEAMDDLTHV